MHCIFGFLQSITKNTVYFCVLWMQSFKTACIVLFLKLTVNRQCAVVVTTLSVHGVWCCVMLCRSVSFSIILCRSVSLCVIMSHGVCFVSFCLILSRSVSFCHCLTLSHSVTFCHILSHSVSFRLILSHSVSFCLTLSNSGSSLCVVCGSHSRRQKWRRNAHDALWFAMVLATLRTRGEPRCHIPI